VQKLTELQFCDRQAGVAERVEPARS